MNPNESYFDFMLEDVEEGILKNSNVGIIRRTLKINSGKVFKEIRYIPHGEEFKVLVIKPRFKKWN